MRYYGQYVAVAVATTFETAKAAADTVRVEYAKDKPNVDTLLKEDDDPEVITTTFGMRNRLQSERGDADAAFAKARRSNWTKLMSRPRKRTIRSSVMRPRLFGTEPT